MLRAISNLIIALWLCMAFVPANASVTHRDINNKTVFSDKLRADNPAKQQDLRNKSATWRKFESKNGHWYVAFDVFTGLPMRAAGKPVSVAGNATGREQAIGFVQNELNGFNIPVEQLTYKKSTHNDKYEYVLFSQTFKGLPVWGSNLNVRITPAKNVVGFTANLFPDIDENKSVVPHLSAGAVVAVAQEAMQGVYDLEDTPQLQILPLPTEHGYSYKLVYAFHLRGIDPEGHVGNYYTLADADDATIYYCHNKIVYNSLGENEQADEQQTAFMAQAEITSFPYSSPEIKAMPFMRFKINGVDYYTDVNGMLDYNGMLPVSATAYLEGSYAQVYKTANSNVVPSFPVTLNSTMPEVTLTVASADISAFAGYYHANTQYLHQRQWLPADFTAFDDAPMEVRVDRTDGDCNAYYDGNINFYAAANGCNATARVADVVYHEFGHGINQYFYDYLGGSFENAALGEGYADVWAMHITQDPVLGPGFFTGGLTADNYVRRYDINKKVYPQDLVGESHADGEIICGAWWDLGQYIGMDPMFTLFVASHYGVPMRPDGEEGLLYADILFETLMADDNDGDISNGTPHSNEIIQAFDEHGISLIISATVEHYELPLFAANQVIPLEMTVDIDFNYLQFLNNVSVFWRTDAALPYEAAVATESAPSFYTANIPAQPAGTIIDYYIQLQSTAGGGPLIPFLANADTDPNLPYQLLVGYQAIQIDMFASGAVNWTLGADGDDAATGFWEVDSPNASFITGAGQVQTGEDFSSSSDNMCAFTGNAAGGAGVGTNDVDDGKTTLISPTFDLSNRQNPAIGYYRWFTNDQGANPGNDPWRVYISNDDGNTWVQVENTYTADHSWRFNAIHVSDYVEPSPHIRLMFVASDSLIVEETQYQGGSLVEAAVDDVTIYDLEPFVGIDSPANTAAVISLSPNPVNNRLSISLPLPEQAPATLKVFNSLSQKMFSTSFANTNAINYILDTDKYALGVYYVSITQGAKSITAKFVKE